MQKPDETPGPGKPEKDVPVKPEPHPDPSRQVPERNDPTRITQPPKVDPTRNPPAPPTPK